MILKFASYQVEVAEIVPILKLQSIKLFKMQGYLEFELSE